MFKSKRWRSDKNKVKAAFKLYFHATQVSQWNSETLDVLVVAGDVGKATARLEKGVVKDGSCRWEFPVYETVKFGRDSKSGKIIPKTYRFVVVSNGSGKNGYVGEVSIDFADYAEASKASTVSLPFKNSKSNGFLHVSIQRLQENVDHGELEEIEDTSTKSKNSTLNILLSNDELDDTMKSHSKEDGPVLDTTQSAELVHDCRGSSGSDVTISSSDSSSGFNTPREVGLRNNILQEHSSFLSSPSLIAAPDKQSENSSGTIDVEHQPPKWGWVVDSDHGTTDDSTISSQSSLTRRRSVEASDIEIEKLKLARQLELSDLELQTLRKQIMKESKKGQELLKELAGLKEERDALQEECEKLKSFQPRTEDTGSKSKSHFDSVYPGAILEEIRQELIYEKDLNANLHLQLRKTQESNAELILAVKDLEEMLEEGKMKGVPDLSNKLVPDVAVMRSESDEDEEQKALEELVKKHTDDQQTYLLEQKIMNLHSGIEIYRRDKDEVEMQLEQLALDYEILKQENHEMSYKLEQSQLQEQLKIQYECFSSFASIYELEAKIESLEHELKKQSEEYSTSLATINELEANVNGLEEEIEKQAKDFEADLEVLMRTKVEQEQRAILAEETLRKTRWHNANTAERLQEELRRLSIQMASTFDANEKVAMNALAEASEFRLQISQLDEMLKKSNEELQSVRNDYEAKLQALSDQLILKAGQIERMLVETEDKSKKLECQKKHEEEVVAAFSEEILKLKSELERLAVENILLLKQAELTNDMEAELEKLKQSSKQSESLVERANAEKNELMNTIALLKEEALRSVEELNQIRFIKSEEVTAVDLLQAEVEKLKARCADLQHSLLEDDAEKEKLRKQLIQLKSNLKKEDAHTSSEKQLKESRRTVAPEGTKSTVKSSKSAQVLHASKEVASLREKIKSLEGQIRSKETALETSAHSFSEKEKDLLDKIAELQSRVEEFNQNCPDLCHYPHHKLVEVASEITSESSMANDARDRDEIPNVIRLTSEENGDLVHPTKREAIVLEKEENISAAHNGDCHANGMLNELESLKERNKEMESELKEMQERYSEISLKFAEVEGERQKLVMTLRSFKNAKKS